MKRKISRREFVSGFALGATAIGLTPLEAIGQGLAPASIAGDAAYPPLLTGLRGSQPGSFEVAHAVAREGRRYSPPDAQTGPVYDLVVVGGGISGLSAAKFFRDRRDRPSKILVLDNHDDFGGHARRNEFDIDGRMMLCYGGSQTIDGPGSYSPVARQLLKDLAIDVNRFYDFYDQEYFSSRNLREGIYFDKATFGADRLTLNPTGILLGEAGNDAEMRAAVGEMPISEEDQAAFIRLLEGGVDYLEGMSLDSKRALLRDISYLDFLKNYAGMPESVREIMRDSFLQLTAVGWEAESAMVAADWGFPGTYELGVKEKASRAEPYIHHFPDGNAGVARSLVRDLVPGAIPGSTMEDLVTARADYSRLDSEDAEVQIRLNSPVVDVRHTQDERFVDITYVGHGTPLRARARHVILACYNNIIPYICSELPEAQVDAIQYATKIPFVKASIALNNWRAFEAAGYYDMYSPGNVYFKHLKLDFPVSMGDYHYPQGADEPMVVSAWFSPTVRGLPAKAQYRAGRARMLEMTFDDFEDDIVGHFDGMLGAHAFDTERDIAAITLNRWPHGYAYEFEGMGVPPGYNRYNGPHIRGRAQIGRISIANSDSEAYAYVDGAIDAADRAVNEQLS